MAMNVSSRSCCKDREVEYFPIGVLSERTGVGTSTLRAWERRYQLLTPERTPKGHRLYTEQHVLLIERILSLLHDGHSLGAIAGKLNAGIDAPPDSGDRQEPEGVWYTYVEQTLLAVHEFSAERIDAVHNEAVSLYPIDLVTERLIEPVLERLGGQWQERSAGIAEEHFYANWVRSRLAARFHHGYSQASGARMVCACLPGHRHDIGLLLFALSALMRGYRVLYFGADLPLSQIREVIVTSDARALVLSAREPLDPAEESALAELTTELDCGVFLGGLASNIALPAFERVGGVRLGSRIGVALRMIGARLPVYGAGRKRF